MTSRAEGGFIYWKNPQLGVEKEQIFGSLARFLDDDAPIRIHNEVINASGWIVGWFDLPYPHRQQKIVLYDNGQICSEDGRILKHEP